MVRSDRSIEWWFTGDFRISWANDVGVNLIGQDRYRQGVSVFDFLPDHEIPEFIMSVRSIESDDPVQSVIDFQFPHQEDIGVMSMELRRCCGPDGQTLFYCAHGRYCEYYTCKMERPVQFGIHQLFTKLVMRAVQKHGADYVLGYLEELLTK